MVSVRIYVEGGGDQRATTAACRQGFVEFFGKVLPTRHRPRVIACGGRDATFDSFRTAYGQKDGLAVLLVDSEGPVSSPPWRHLKDRDGWNPPGGATDNHAHLMVQCMEAWLLADREALAAYYGQGFLQGNLPGEANVELIDKGDIFRALNRATRQTATKGIYRKTSHGFGLLSRIDPAKVRAASNHAERLCTFLLDVL